MSDKRREEKRRPVPLAVALQVALRQLSQLMGCDPSELQLDHDPALIWRPWNDEHTDTVPPANDPAHLIFRKRAGDHDVKTFGPGGEKRIHTRGSDVAEPRRLDRISDKTKEFQRRMGMSPAERKAEKRSRWPSRPFPKRPKTGAGGSHGRGREKAPGGR